METDSYNTMLNRPINNSRYTYTYTKAGMINRLINYNQSILKILLIIDCNYMYKYVISIMIIPNDILFKHVAANNVQYGSDMKPL